MESIITIAMPDFAGASAGLREQTLRRLTRYTPEPHEIVLFVPQGQERDMPEGMHTLPVPFPFAAPAALNRLVTMCATPYILFLETGASVTSGWLARLLEPLRDADVGLSGPSTNLSWNEQQVLPRYAGTRYADAQIDAFATSVAARYAGQRRSLDTLHSLADFCYLFKRNVALELGGFDEAYGDGPCWEIDFTTRAARAGFRAIWVLDAYVHRSPAIQRYPDAHLFTRNKHLYQDRFCGLRLSGQKTSYEPHCRGAACEHFAPPQLITVRLNRNTAASLAMPESGDTTSFPASECNVGARLIAPAPPMGMESAQESAPDCPHVLPPEGRDQSRPSGGIGNEGALPLVSCIMPTCNRRAFVRQALLYFERQDYPNRELVIVDDGEDRVADLVAGHPLVRYIARDQKLSIGAKRNLACELAQGAIIAHWDDDDWYAPHRLSYQLAPLLAEQADITGLETACFFDLQHWQAWACSPSLHRRLFVGDVHGGTLVYWRRVWERLAHYPNLSIAEDARFLLAACQRQARLQKLAHGQCFVYLRHERNAWRFPPGSYLDSSGWQTVDLSAFLPEEDQAFYRALSPQSETVGAAACPRPTPDTFPLVSCIMPTYNRQRYVEQSIRYFLRQDYPNRELIILDDSPQAIDELIPADTRIRYIHLEARMILGAKRNLACRLAHGSIIAHWDDDDWIAPERLRVQVELLERQRAELCGTYRQLYYDSDNHRAWLYEYPHVARRLPLGNTLCYRKALWERNPFPEIAVGEDMRFVWSRQVRNIAFLNDHSFYVGLIHRGNTSRKILTGACWHSRPVEEVSMLLGPDADFYLNGKV